MLENRISEVRKAKGYTQEYVADQLGVSRQAVTKWESGSSRPNTENLLKLADLFDMTIDELVNIQQFQTSALEEYAQLKLQQENQQDIQKRNIFKNIFLSTLVIGSLFLLGLAIWVCNEMVGLRIYVFYWLEDWNVLLITCMIAIVLLILQRPFSCASLFLGSIAGTAFSNAFVEFELTYSPVNHHNGWVYYMVFLFLFGIAGLLLDYKYQTGKPWKKAAKIGFSAVLAIVMLITGGFAYYHVGYDRGADVGYSAGYALGQYDARNGFEINHSHKGITPEPEDITPMPPRTKDIWSTGTPVIVMGILNILKG